MPLGPVPASQFGQLLLDLRSSIEQAYAVFALSSICPQIRLTSGLLPSWDCADTLWIILRGSQPSQIQGLTDSASGCEILAEALITIELARCWPSPDDAGRISVEAELEATLGLAQDATVLWYGLGNRWKEGVLFESDEGLDCEAVRFGILQPVGPAGGFAGWSWQLRISMFGSPEEE